MRCVSRIFVPRLSGDRPPRVICWTAIAYLEPKGGIMGRYVAGRFAGLVFALVLVSIITFLLMHAVPGGAARDRVHEEEGDDRNQHEGEHQPGEATRHIPAHDSPFRF